MFQLRDALRTLWHRPLVTAVAIVSLALGTGANLAIFSVFNQALLRRLPVPEPDRLVNLRSPGRKTGNVSTDGAAGDTDGLFTYPMFRDLERVQTAFTGIAAHRGFPASLEFAGQTLSGRGTLVSGGYFSVLGLRPALGRLLGPDDDRTPGEGRGVVLSHDYWRVQFDESPSVLDETLVVNGQTMNIVGVAPAGFEGTTVTDPPQVFVPMTMSGQMRPGWNAFENRRDWSLYLFARLGPGVSRDAAQQAINVPFQAITREVEIPLYADAGPQALEAVQSREVLLEPGDTGQRPPPGRIWLAFALLLTVTGTVLIVACGNIAQLLLARAAARSREIAIRLAIGASRRQLVGQLLIESCLLAVSGGLAGLIVAGWTLDLMGSFLPASASTLVDLDLDRSTWLFMVGITIAAGLLVGLFPAWHSTRPDLVTALKNQSGHLTGARSATRFRLSLATVQIGLSMALLVMAGLFTRSLWNLGQVDLGFDSANLVTFTLSPELSGYDPARASGLFERVQEELAAIPGVTRVSASTLPLLTRSNQMSSVAVDGFRGDPDGNTSTRYAMIGPDYFRTLGVPLVAGREFTRGDAPGAPAVAIVNEAFTARFELGRNAVGARMGVGSRAVPDIEIVGLVRDAKYSETKEPAPPQFFLPYRQSDGVGAISFYARTAQDPSVVMPTIPAAIARLDRTLPVENLRTMSEQVRQNMAADRLIGTLSAVFAVLATFLAAIGLYGMLAYTVAQRTREIGVRIALGADTGVVRRMVLGQVAWMFAVGGCAGIVVAIALGRVARSLLYGLQSHDPAVVAAAAATLALIAFGAGMVPAYRASRIDPIRALRLE